jgi:uncharacterized delta-60 repeat protein
MKCFAPKSKLSFSTELHKKSLKSFRKTALLFCCSVAALLVFSVTLHAQPVLDNFDPNVDNIVRTVVVQPDGKVLVGGIFTSVAPNGGVPVTRNRIARFNSDGTLDTAFDPNANSDVYSMAVQSDGKILVGGYFTSIGGTNLNRIARLDAITGQADLSFNPNANDVVRSILVQSNGMILVCGDFIKVGGTNRNRIARLDPATGLADSFDPNANSFSSSVYSMIFQSDGKLLVGGTFTNIGGAGRNRIARLDPATGLADSFNPDADNDVLSLAVQSDGKILVGGFFNHLGGQPRNFIGRVDSTSGLADSFDPNANTTVHSLLVQPDGKILVAGGFTFIGGDARGHFARLDPLTGLVDSFNPNLSQTVYSVKLQADGKIVVGGAFTFASTQPRGRIARFAPPPMPYLNIQRNSGKEVVLLWPTNFTGFTLEANTNLSLNAWNTVSPSPIVSGTNNVVTNDVSSGALFYRLRN